MARTCPSQRRRCRASLRACFAQSDGQKWEAARSTLTDVHLCGGYCERISTSQETGTHPSRTSTPARPTFPSCPPPRRPSLRSPSTLFVPVLHTKRLPWPSLSSLDRDLSQSRTRFRTLHPCIFACRLRRWILDECACPQSMRWCGEGELEETSSLQRDPSCCSFPLKRRFDEQHSWPCELRTYLI
jgi:hypothetical protein